MQIKKNNQTKIEETDDLENYLFQIPSLTHKTSNI